MRAPLLITLFLLFPEVAPHFVIAAPQIGCLVSSLGFSAVNARARIAARGPHLAYPYSSPNPPKSVGEGEENWRGDTVSRSVLLFPKY